MKNMFARSSSNSRQKGQDLVEFALVFPLLFLILFGVIDLGRIFHASISISNAAREGARYATLDPNFLLDFDGVLTQEFINDVKNYTLQESKIYGVDVLSSNIQVSCPEGTCKMRQPIQVTVYYDLDLYIKAILPDPSLRLGRHAEMMVQ